MEKKKEGASRTVPVSRKSDVSPNRENQRASKRYIERNNTPAETLTQTPGQANYSAAAPAAGGAPRQPDNLVQGRYRVGDWVEGWGTVTSIRKTPKGDHLTTESGKLFAPAAAAPAAGAPE